MIKELINILGIDIKRIKKRPYEELLSIERYKETTIQLLDYDFTIADGPSFFWSYQEIFLDNIYKFDTNNLTPRIIDCGSNYGTSVIYFKNIYPNAIITAIEADPDIYNLLKNNIQKRGLKDVEIINKAVSNKGGTVNFAKEGADAGHITDSKEETLTVETINIDDLINGPIDFLKMDIEGAETDVLCNCNKLHHVSQLFVEYHSFKNRKQNLSKLLEKLSINNFRYYIHTQFCSPRPLTEEKLQLGMDLQLNIFARKA